MSTNPNYTAKFPVTLVNQQPSINSKVHKEYYTTGYFYPIGLDVLRWSDVIMNSIYDKIIVIWWLAREMRKESYTSQPAVEVL